MIGDCDSCGHSVAYHVPLMGCMKCDCDEFHARPARAASPWVLLLAAWVALFAAACTSDKDARRCVEDMGFEVIEVGGHDFFTCGDDYTFSTHFRAKNPQGKVVEGTVCSGWMKGCSVKF